MFKIIAVNGQGREEIDSFDDIDEARRMCVEYQIAFGSGFEILMVAPLFSERAHPRTLDVLAFGLDVLCF